MIACILLFVVEMLLHLPVLALSPVLPMFTGMVFMAKAGILNGAFYIQAAAAIFLTALVMPPDPPVQRDNLRPGHRGLLLRAR